MSKRKPSGDQVCVCAGAGWSLWWPSAVWLGMSAAEQAEVIERQSALMSGRERPARPVSVGQLSMLEVQ